MAKTLTAQVNAQVDTAQSKFGGASMLLNPSGSTDEVTTPDHADFTFGSGDFTVEFWVRINAMHGGANKKSFVIEKDARTGDTTNSSWTMYQADDLLHFDLNTDGTGAGWNSHSWTWTPSTATWYHVAVSRSGNNLRAFIDGTQIGSTDDVTGITVYDGTATLHIGKSNGYDSLGYYLDGWYDEIRISTSARYTSNFTPPSSAFTCADASTVLLVHCDGTDASTTFTDDTTACAVGPTNLKTINGLAKASIKTVNGLAIASVKSVNGLT